jgi:DNA polymerase elongation subunit (family B)
MYRFASYNPFNESVYLRTWTESGDRIDTEIPFRPYLFLEKEGATDATSIFKTSLVKKVFKNSLERRRFAEGTANKRIFHNLGPEQQFLIESYKDQNNDPNFSRFPLKIFYLDIETQSNDGFPVPEKAKDPINLITVHDSITNSTHTWGLAKSYSSKEESCVYHRCKDEQDLVLQFVDFWKSDYPDIVSGWNSENFDIPYIINRFAKLFGQDFLQQLSPIGQVRSRQIFADDSFGKEVTKWSIGGVALLDYMKLYKTFKPGEKESFSLNYISELELGEGKIAYNATSLSQLSEEDWSTFVEYNIQDVHLLVKLEEKLKFLEIARMLSYKGCTNFEAALGKVAIVTGAVAIQAAKQGYVIPTFGVSLERESYEGGYVRDPEKGIQKSVVSFDVNSLYPNTIITLNISPETKIGKIVSGEYGSSDEVTIRLVNGKTHTLSSEKLKQFLEKENISLSKAGVMYSQKVKGVIPNLIDQIYKERVATKNELTKLKRGKNKSREALLKIVYFDTLQYTLKILLNSIYGTFANKHSSLMDIDHAMSITVTGQNVSKAGGNIIDDFVKQKYGVTQSITKYGDTDSLYISIQPVLDKLNIPLLTEENINPEVHKIVDEIDKHVNVEILTWARKELFSIDPRYVFKREVISDVGIFLQKKRYILHVLDEEGVATNKFKYTGIELVRSTTPKKVKKFIEDVIKVSLLTEDIKQANETYRTSYEDFCSLDPNDIAARTSINNLDKYSQGASLYKYKKGTPSHVKGAIAYNILIKELNLDNTLETIQTGQKVKKVYCAKNKYGLDAITYVSILPKEFGISVDWDKMFSKLVTQPVERLYDAIGWTLPEIGKEVQTDLFELLN